VTFAEYTRHIDWPLTLLGLAAAAISSAPAGTVDAVGPSVTGTSVGDGVTALLFGLGGYAGYAVASIWTGKSDAVSWIDAAALPSSAEAVVGVLRQLDVQRGETLLLFGGGGSVGIIATQLAVARGVTVVSAVGEHDEPLARELGATPVRYGRGVADRVRTLGRGGRRVRRGRPGCPGRRDRPGRRARAGHHLVRPGRR
jgi:NADPH:quinone reductase-like Zn-dependent oxidoreductase